MPVTKSHVLLTVMHDTKLSTLQVAQQAAQRLYAVEGVVQAGALPLVDMTVVSTPEYQALLVAKTKLEALRTAA